MKIKNIYRILILFLLLMNSAHAQIVGTLSSDTTFPGTYLQNLARGYNNEFILFSESPDSTFLVFNYHFAINRFDRNGNFISALGSEDILAKRAIRTSDLGYLFSSNSTDFYGQVLFKTDSLLNIQWSKKLKPARTYLDISSPGLIEVNGFYFTQNFFYLPDTALVIAKLDAAGNLLNYIAVTDTVDDITPQFAMTSALDGGIYFISRGSFRSNVFKLDTGLNILWSKTFYGTSRFTPRYLKSFSDSSIVISGDLQNNCCLIMKVDLNGNVVFAKSISSPGTINTWLDPSELPNGNIALSGYMLSGSFTSQPLHLKMDPGGNLISANVYNFGLGGTRYLYNYVDPVADSVFIFGGYGETLSTVPGAKIIFIRTDTAFSGICFEAVPSISCVNESINDSTFIPQVATWSIFFQDTAISFYPVGMESKDMCGFLTDVSEMHTGHLKIYPNPFTSSAILELESPATGAALNLYNSMGVLVRRMHVEGKTTMIQRDELPGGLYYFEVVGPEAGTIGKGRIIMLD